MPHAREKNEYLKIVYAYDQEAKKNGLNLVNTSKENIFFFLNLTYLYACFLKCLFRSFFASEYVGAFSSEQGIEPLGIRI